MEAPELLDLIINAIVQTRKGTSGNEFELVPSSENRLIQFPKALILSTISSLSFKEKVIELRLPPPQWERGKNQGNYDFNVEEGKIYWREVHTDGWIPVVNTFHILDEQVPIRIQLLKTFDNWLSAYQSKKQDNLEALSLLTLAKIHNTVLDIDDKLQIDPGPEVQITPTFRDHLHSILGQFNHLEFREDALKYLKRVGVISSYYPVRLDPALFADHRSGVRVTVDVQRFREFKPRIAKEYHIKAKEAAPASARTSEQADKRDQQDGNQQTDAVYEVKFTAAREIWINGFLLSQLDFNSENDNVFKYLYENPNKTISSTELEKQLGGDSLKKSLHKIVENLGFTREIKHAFFAISKNSIQFRNPITKKELEELGVSWLRFPRR